MPTQQPAGSAPVSPSSQSSPNTIRNLLLAILAVLVACSALAVWLNSVSSRDGDKESNSLQREPVKVENDGQPTDPEARVFDSEALAKGDFSSAQGRWIGKQGREIVISGNILRWYEDHTLYLELDGLTVTTQSSQLPPEVNDDNRTAFVHHDSNSVSLQWPPAESGAVHGTALILIPKNTQPDNPLVNSSIGLDPDNDRIVMLAGIGVGRLTPVDVTPYVAVRENAVSSGSSQAEARNNPPSEHSSVLAGGPRPANAQPAESVIESPYGGMKTASFVTPSKNIGCDIIVTDNEPDLMNCNVSSWKDNPPVQPINIDPVHGGSPIISFGYGDMIPEYGGAKHDGFCYMEGYCEPGSKPQILNYGQVLYFGNFVCASEESGLSCWNEETGHGAFMSREHFEAY
ncbi:hypothetical protein [Arcanobacterium phocae]|uniref:hypothetical protein n=1 Tax=Arcanobacterium phocae TaxID=131112 RepID=UPI001C11E26E|nr:hypothetical protein [Arcanobacterium phocae]